MKSKNVLLLQGPMGSFFARYARYLSAQGYTVWKINLNGGDLLFSGGCQNVSYRGDPAGWPEFLASFVKANQIGRIFLFGDCRGYHRTAATIAAQLDVRLYVFEEGYIRPDFITLEEKGVNGFSTLPRNPRFYLKHAKRLPKPSPLPANTSFHRMARSAIAYYAANILCRPLFPHYEHHHKVSVFEALNWCRSGARKLLAGKRDAALTKTLATNLSGQYFFVPLQVHYDSQVRVHSAYKSIEEFIAEVLASFAQNAPENFCLVFKHHPMDRGARHYGDLIASHSATLGITGRVFYAHEMHLPTVLSNARGVVVINSTVGLSALFHRAPVKVMGEAVYDMPGLTSQKSLARFWRAPGKVSGPLIDAYRAYLVAHTQVNGSFYGREPFPCDTAVPDCSLSNDTLIQQQA